MTHGTVSAEKVAELREKVYGPVLVDGDAGYDEARVAWNGMYDNRRPGVLVQCKGVADVQDSVAFARANDLTIAVRGGGHSLSGASTIQDGILIDMSLMRGVHVDPVARTAVAAAGTLWGEFDRETQVHALAGPGGMISHTGIAGLTLGGGVGRFMRKHGLTCDNVRSFDIVTADSELLHVDADNHPDLFWALRGGGGDFGIVTHFEYDLHPLGPTVLGGFLGWELSQLKQLFAELSDEIANAPEELMIQIVVIAAPALPFIPEHLHGMPSVLGTFTWMGEDQEEGARYMAPFREKVKPAYDVVGELPYAPLQAMGDGLAPHGRRVYSKAGYLGDVTQELLDTVIAAAETFPTEYSLIELYQMGGAVSRVPADDTAASAFRAAAWYYITGSSWYDEQLDESCTEWVRQADDSLTPFRLPGRYINFVSNDDAEGQLDAIGEKTFARLAEVKAKYDPASVFARNPNKTGAAATAAVA